MNQIARVRFSDVLITTENDHDLRISGMMDVDIRFYDDVDALEFDMAEGISDVDIQSAKALATGRKVAVKDGGKLVAKLLGSVAVRDRLMDEAQQLGWEWSQANAADIQNGVKE